MRMNFKNVFMGLAAWLVLGFALHGSDKDKGELGFVEKQKDVDAFQKKLKEHIEADDKK